MHLHDAHQRVMSVAAVQQQLQASGLNESIEIGPYLSKLCDSLAKSMVGDRRPISIKVQTTSGRAVSSEAVSLGLIVTELVINALKHAFPSSSEKGEILVKYDGRKLAGASRYRTMARGLGEPVRRFIPDWAQALLEPWHSNSTPRLRNLPAQKAPPCPLLHPQPAGGPGDGGRQLPGASRSAPNTSFGL